MFRLNARLNRRRFAASAAGYALARSISPVGTARATTDVVVEAPYVAQGFTGASSAVNCGPATVAAAVNYSGVASPTTEEIRATLGVDGPTDIDAWAWLLDWYGVPWFSTWSQWEMDAALRTAHVLVVAAWMDDFSQGWDLDQAWSPNWGQPGRYSDFAEGHALLIIGTADDGYNYVVHDPNVFEEGMYWYDDGSPKGAYRRYAAAELWNTVASYADGLALAVASPPVSAPPPKPVKRVRPEPGEMLAGPGGGYRAVRGSVSEPAGAAHGANRPKTARSTRPSEEPPSDS